MAADRRGATDQINRLLAEMSELTIFELREEWRRHHRMAPPKRLSRDLLLRGIAFKVQERLFGGLSKRVLRTLASALATGRQGRVAWVRQKIVLKPGTRLVREWRGVTHTVLVGADDFEWRGQRFASLSEIARAVTGAHWSGPRFFGLKASGGTRADADRNHGET